ncbi:MAG: PIN domain-containing protein, partial [Myxococcota bacterium]
MKRIYLDASSIIYLVEGLAPFHQLTTERVLAHRAARESEIVTSRLSRLECRVKPLRADNGELLNLYDAFFAKRDIRLVDVRADIIERATALRARHGFATPDALYLATAIAENADTVLTGDANWQRCTDIQVEVIKPTTPT